MKFWEQLLATFIGATAGFIFSLVLFWLKEQWKQNRLIKNLLVNLHFELEYNLNLFKKYSERVTECIEAVNSGNRQVYINLDYTFIASYFSLQFYREGLASKYLHYEDVKQWNDVLSNHSQGMEQYILDILESWRKSEVEKEKVFNLLKHERDNLNYGIKMTEYLKTKIPS
ncbi:MAG: hypothetical protein ACHQ2F_04485 [Desulfobaccales bacterium]